MYTRRAVTNGVKQRKEGKDDGPDTLWPSIMNWSLVSPAVGQTD